MTSSSRSGGENLAPLLINHMSFFEPPSSEMLQAGMVDAGSQSGPRYPVDQASRIEFWKRLHAFNKYLGQPDPQIPSVAGKEIDLYLLFNEVYTAGGLAAVDNGMLWKNVGLAIGNLSQSQNIFRSAYVNNLYGYEVLCMSGHRLPYEELQRRIMVSRLQLTSALSSRKPVLCGHVCLSCDDLYCRHLLPVS